MKLGGYLIKRHADRRLIYIDVGIIRHKTFNLLFWQLLNL